MLLTSVDLIKENEFTLAKARTVTSADNADDIALLANTQAQAQSLLHSQEQAAGGIRLHINADKIEFMCFNQRGEIPTLNSRSMKLVDKFDHLGSKNHINTRLAKAWTVIDILSVIWKSD